MKTTLYALLFWMVFWNVENLFEDKPGFRGKCDAIAKTILMMSDSEGSLPDAIALAEVGGRDELTKLLNRTALRKYRYRIIHYNSPDRRRIDCALLYREASVRVRSSKAVHIADSAGRILQTRDILLVETDSLAILVNHHPSKVGKGSEEKRKLAFGRMDKLCDSLDAAGASGIICVGDFNDNLWGDFNQGTIKYNGRWDKRDGFFARGVEVEERVFTAPHLLTEDRKFGGEKPFRAYSGPRYIGGVSDHLPIILYICPKQ